MTTPRTAQTLRGAAPPEEIKAVPVRHPGRWLAAAVVLLLAAMLIHTLVTNPRFQWDVIGSYFLSHRVLEGLELTILLTVVAMGIGIVLGVILAVMRLSPNPLLSLWYLVVTSVLTAGQFYLERHYARGSARQLPLTPLQRIRRYLLTFHPPPPHAHLPSGEQP